MYNYYYNNYTLNLHEMQEIKHTKIIYYCVKHWLFSSSLGLVDLEVVLLLLFLSLLVEEAARECQEEYSSVKKLEKSV